MSNNKDDQGTQNTPNTQSSPHSVDSTQQPASSCCSSQSFFSTQQPETQPKALPQTPTQAADFVPVLRFPDPLPPTLLVNTPSTESFSSESLDSQFQMHRQ